MSVHAVVTIWKLDLNPDLQQSKTDICRILPSAALNAITGMIGTVRFSKIVETVGKPSVHVLWIDPEKDAILQKAIKANRVMTIHQRPDGTKSDYGTIGFEKNVPGQVLIFPKTLRSFTDKRVIGVKYDLLEWAAAPKGQQAPKAEPAKPAIKSKPKEIPVTIFKPPFAEESAPAGVVKFPSPKVEAEDRPNEDVEQPELKFIEGGADLLDTVRPLWKKLNALHAEKSPHFAEAFAKTSFSERKADLENKAIKGELLVILAVTEAEDCVCSVDKESRDSGVSKVGEIDSMFVSLPYRRQGIGQQLVKRCMEWFERNEAEKVIVLVAAGNEEVLEFYKIFGFLPFAIRLEKKGSPKP
jgi:GNAT superfamily N-acetyltransferase